MEPDFNLLDTEGGCPRPIKRTPYFLPEESKCIILERLKRQYNILFGQKSSGITRWAKQDAWNEFLSFCEQIGAPFENEDAFRRTYHSWKRRAKDKAVRRAQKKANNEKYYAPGRCEILIFAIEQNNTKFFAPDPQDSSTGSDSRKRKNPAEDDPFGDDVVAINEGESSEDWKGNPDDWMKRSKNGPADSGESSAKRINNGADPDMGGTGRFDIDEDHEYEKYLYGANPALDYDANGQNSEHTQLKLEYQKAKNKQIERETEDAHALAMAQIKREKATEQKEIMAMKKEEAMMKFYEAKLLCLQKSKTQTSVGSSSELSDANND